MTIKVAIGQFAPTENKNDNLNTINNLVANAAKSGARLVVLPEYAIYTVGVMDERFVDNSESLDGPCITALLKLSKKLNIAIILGINESTNSNRIYNTLVGIDNGEIKALYRKVHLYDAFGYQESARVIAAEPNNGNLLELDEFKIGMQTCYDLRFPEITRVLVDSGANVIALPAEWIPGPLKEYHWNTLIRARAIENTVFIIAADQCAPTGVGNSTILDPMGIAVASVGEREGLAISDISLLRLSEVRNINPALNLRRYKITTKE